jgi:hypothetical protein
MSNTNEELEDAIGVDTSDLRGDDFQIKVAPAVEPAEKMFTGQHQRLPFVKPVIHVEGAPPKIEDALTPAQMIAISQIVEQRTREAISASSFNPKMEAQVVDKSKLPITDFSKMSLDDVYDLSLNIEAKPFMSADALAIKLKDTNYEARWVNKNPQRIGQMIARGFTYITDADLVSSDAIEASKDAQNHYSFDDVVAMKIDKATYFRALRAAHERAVATTDEVNARKRAAMQANGFMNQKDDPEYGSHYQPDYNPSDSKSALHSGKLKFYDPGVGI